MVDGAPTTPPVKHLHNGRGEEAHPVRSPLLVVDMTLPAAVGVLLQHLHPGSTRNTESSHGCSLRTKEVTGS